MNELRDSMIEQAKVIVNINEFDRESGVELSHSRIRNLLAKGKVVVSERSGTPEADAVYSDVVTFTDEYGLFWAAYKLLRDFRRRQLLSRKAVDFIAREQRTDHPHTVLHSLFASMADLRSSLVFSGEIVGNDNCSISIETSHISR